jgi:hypothetical protein
MQAQKMLLLLLLLLLLYTLAVAVAPEVYIIKKEENDTTCGDIILIFNTNPTIITKMP